MERARKRIRMFLMVVVTMAVLVGLIYYFQDAQSPAGFRGGTLITMPGGAGLCR